MERKLTTFQQDVIDRLGRIEEQNKTQFNRLEALEKSINGNGQPGLLTRVGNLEMNWRWVKWLAGIIGAGVGFLASLFIKN